MLNQRPKSIAITAIPSPGELREVRRAMEMAGTTPPLDSYGQYATNSGNSGYGSGQSESPKSPLSASLGFLKNLTERKNTRVDGQPLKRRGPKPDSKPALTRRQELNRQAQRTHRERKELYIKALEQEVLRLKDNYSRVTRDKETLADENRALKLLLAQHGIPWNGTGGVAEFQRLGSTAYSSTGSMSGSYAQDFSSPSHNPSLTPDTGLSPSGGGRSTTNGQSLAQRQMQPTVDYDQAGIDFVLTLERPCMDHMGFLVDRASEHDGEPCGHALMATCPPDAYIEGDFAESIPFGHGLQNLPGGQQQKTWDISKSDLANLLDLSKRLNLDGEITPVMAWGMILSHERFGELTVEDFRAITEELGAKTRCYGFGAVLEEFEVRDAMENVFSRKMDTKHYF